MAQAQIILPDNGAYADVDRHSLLQESKIAMQIREQQERLIAQSYDKAATYTTIIVFGGYAGAFALWQMTKEFLTKGQVYWIALLLLISLSAFVLFEVGKMALMTRTIMSKAKLLQEPGLQQDPVRFLAALKALDLSYAALHRPFMIGWAIALVISVGAGVAAISVLAYALVSGLAR